MSRNDRTTTQHSSQSVYQLLVDTIEQDQVDRGYWCERSMGSIESIDSGDEDGEQQNDDDKNNENVEDDGAQIEGQRRRKRMKIVDKEEDYLENKWDSKEELLEMSVEVPNASYPKVTDWRNELTDPINDVFVTVDTTRRDLKESLVQEVLAVRKGFDGVLQDHGSGLMSPDDLTPSVFDRVFGNESDIQDLFRWKKLHWSRHRYYSFNSTFAMQAKYKTSAEGLFDDKFSGDLNLSGCLRRHEYMSCWDDIARSGVDDDEGDVEGDCPFWTLLLEGACNALLISVFLKYLVPKETMCKFVAIDDDKIKLGIRPGTKTKDGLKVVNHAQRKRMGFVCHTAGASLSGMPFSIRWERRGDTTSTCYFNLVLETFGKGHGINDMNLTRFVFFLDRGYWTQPVLFDLLLQSGADVLGTVKRSWWVPFTFNQTLGASDRRVLIDTKGHKCVYIKTATYKGKKLSIQDFRTGNGRVVLSMSSYLCHHQYNFEISRDTDVNDDNWIHTLQIQGITLLHEALSLKSSFLS